MGQVDLKTAGIVPKCFF